MKTIKENIKKLLFLSVFLSVFLFSGQVQAQFLTVDDIKDNMAETGEAASYDNSGDEDNLLLADVVNIVASAILSLLGIIFLIMIIIGGYNWMTAAGNEEKVTKAKATLFRGVIGLMIIVAAYVITAFVFNALGGIVGRA